MLRVFRNSMIRNELNELIAAMCVSLRTWKHVESNTSGNNDSRLFTIFTLLPILRCSSRIFFAIRIYIYIYLSISRHWPLQFSNYAAFSKVAADRREASNCPYVHPIAPPDFIPPLAPTHTWAIIHTQIYDLYEHRRAFSLAAVYTDYLESDKPPASSRINFKSIFS